ncbi:hypothetical protein KURONO_2003 [Mycobacterium tuberculosis str. Kurono]|nr:hypothetical protein KURONO_2003 [Mycobacterium tuberculosis str. Kurono]
MQHNGYQQQQVPTAAIGCVRIVKVVVAVRISAINPTRMTPAGGPRRPR